jgi:hypothetical protein
MLGNAVSCMRSPIWIAGFLLSAFRRWHRDSKRLPGGSGRATGRVQMDLTIPQKLAFVATIPRFTRIARLEGI